MIVGLSGYARSGKDEAAKALTAVGWERRAFANVLREFLLRLDPVVSLRGPDPVRFSTVIAQYGWDGYKESPFGIEMRELMQRVGTECGRELIHDEVWIDATIGDLRRAFAPKLKVVVTDVRFPNEFKAIQNSGGMMIRIHRPGVEPANGHVSETALDEYANYFDADIINNGSINELHDKVRRAVAVYF